MNATLQLSSADVENQSIQLRSELKRWEREFAASHNGRKAGREDIKQNPDIASKYKNYDRLRQTLSQPAKLIGKEISPTRTKKRLSAFHESSAEDSLMQTPSKRAKHAHPLHSQPVKAFASRPLHPTLLNAYDPPTSTLLSPGKTRTCLGPTPQKDGKVLGLFDILSSSSIDRTPSKRKILDAVAGNAQRADLTPSKSSAAHGETQKLPGSASTGLGLTTVSTPSGHRVTKAKPNSTPVSARSVRRLDFDETPAFLRRDSQRTAIAPQGDEDGEVEAAVWSPIVPQRASKLRRPPGAGRGLSALVRGLREMEEERLDEDLDLLREVEGGGDFDSFACKMSNDRETMQTPKMLLGDSRIPDMRLGPDGAIESEGEAENEEGKTRDGRPLKVWKKKGQKRTTRAVKMKPSNVKWKAEPAWKVGVESENEMEVDKMGIARKTDVMADEGTANDETATNEAAFRMLRSDEMQGTTDSRKDGFVEKVKKKISATAHANFRALKIRNKNSKAKGGSSRFRKRR